jgi:hypothetical protein
MAALPDTTIRPRFEWDFGNIFSRPSRRIAVHAIKNTIVAIMLLGISYGVYQVIMTPDPTQEQCEPFPDVQVEDEPQDSIEPDMFDHAAQRQPASDNRNLEIPDELLKEKPAIDDQQTPDREDAFPDSNQLAADRTGNLSPPPLLNAKIATEEQGDIASSMQSDFRGGLPASLDRKPQLDADTQLVEPLGEMQSVDLGKEGTSPDQTGSAPDVATNHGDSNATLAEAWPAIQGKVSRGDYQDALTMLTQFYRHNRIPEDQLKPILDWLDTLAAKVIYSTEHHLSSMPYIVQPGDSIAQLARKWRVPAQLIYNINRRMIPDPEVLTPGVEIKIIEGPFDAEVDAENGVMTLYLQQMYAGRFHVRTGDAVKSGEFSVVDKIPRGSEQGDYWIRLDRGFHLHASSETTIPADSIALENQEAAEVFAILSASSKVKVLR